MKATIRTKIIVTASGLAMVTVGMYSGLAPAVATYFGPLYADGPEHSFFIGGGLPAAKDDKTLDAMAYLDTATDMYDYRHSQLWQGTDIHFYGSHVTSGEEANWYAWAVCTDAVSSSVCDNWKVVTNTALPHNNHRSLMCHEIGHTIGLRHNPGRNDSYSSYYWTCMRSNPDVGSYNSHDIGHVNSRY